MLGAIKVWFTALSTVAKIGVVSGTLMTGGVAKAALAPTATIESPVAVAVISPKIVEAETQQSACTSKAEELVELETIPYQKTIIEDSSTQKGKSYIKVYGLDGTNQLIYTITKYTPNGCKLDEKVLTKKQISKDPVTEVTAVGTYLAPAPKSNCDSNYSPCIPNVSYDLDCADIGFSVTVIGYDNHRLDRDGDGYGCESY